MRRIAFLATLLVLLVVAPAGAAEQHCFLSVAKARAIASHYEARYAARGAMASWALGGVQRVSARKVRIWVYDYDAFDGYDLNGVKQRSNLHWPVQVTVRGGRAYVAHEGYTDTPPFAEPFAC